MPRSLYTTLTKHLSDERFIRFLEHVAAQGERPTSIHHLLASIRELGSVQAALDEAGEKSEYLTAELRITKHGANRYRIRFGEAGGLVGDGGEWTVLFHPDGRVKQVIAHIFWTC